MLSTQKNSQNITISIDKVIKNSNEIGDINQSDIDETEIPNKLIIYIELNTKDKDLLKYYDKQFVFNFTSSNTDNKKSQKYDVKSLIFFETM